MLLHSMQQRDAKTRPQDKLSFRPKGKLPVLSALHAVFSTLLYFYYTRIVSLLSISVKYRRVINLVTKKAVFCINHWKNGAFLVLFIGRKPMFYI